MTSAAEQLEALYATIPSIACSGKCHPQCSIIPASPAERQRIADAGKPMPAEIPRDRPGALALVLAHPNAACPNLTPLGTCGVYTLRPMICRLYGVAEGLPCTYGCQPDRVISKRDALALIAAAELIEPDRSR